MYYDIKKNRELFVEDRGPGITLLPNKKAHGITASISAVLVGNND